MAFYIGGNKSNLIFDFYSKTANSTINCPLKIYEANVDPNTPNIPTDPIWQEVVSQSMIDRIKSQNDLPITGTADSSFNFTYNNIPYSNNSIHLVDDFKGTNPNKIQISSGDGNVHYTLTGQTLKNEIQNGDFSNGTTGWISINSTTIINNNTAINTGDGTSQSPYFRQDLDIINGHKYYLVAKAKVTNDLCSVIKWRTSQTQTVDYIINSPVKNTLYVLSHIMTALSDSLALNYLMHSYADSTTANGKVMEVQEVMAIDMGADSSNPDYNLTQAQMDAKYANWFDGIQSTGENNGGAGVDKIEVLSRGSNIFDKNKWVDDGNYTVSKCSPSTLYYVPSKINIQTYDSNMNIITTVFSTTKTTESNACYIGVRNDNVKTSGIDTFYISEINSFSPYTEDKINILTKLAGVGGVGDTCDDFGNVTRNTGKVVLDGTGSWSDVSTQDNATTMLFALSPIVNYTTSNNDIIVDKLNVVDVNILYSPTSTTEGISKNGVGVIRIRILKSKLTTQDVAGFKAWLQANPTTVYYQLATPTTETVSVTPVTGYSQGNILFTTGAISPSSTTINNYLLSPTDANWTNGDKTNVGTLDGNTLSVTSDVLGATPQIKVSFDLVSMIEQKYGTIQGNTLADKIQILKDNLASITVKSYQKGIQNINNKSYISDYSTSWIDALSNTTSTISLLSLSETTNIVNLIDSNGFINYNIYTNNSDGTPSTIYLDYVDIELTFKTPIGNTVLSPNDNRRDGISTELLMADNTSKTVYKYFTNESLQQECTVVNDSKAYLVEIDLSGLITNLQGGSLTAFNSTLLNITGKVYGKASGDNGGVLTYGLVSKIWNSNSSAYSDTATNTNSQIALSEINLTANLSNYITTDQKLYYIMYSQYPASATISSQLELDYFASDIGITRVPDVLNPVSITL